MSRFEEFTVKGGEVVGQIKHLIHQGNVRSITVRGKDGRTIVQFPLTIGVVGAALAPVFAGIGAIVALVAECTIVVERDEQAPPETIRVEPHDPDATSFR